MCGLYRSENAGMSSEIYVRIIKAESLRFLEEGGRKPKVFGGRFVRSKLAGS